MTQRHEETKQHHSPLVGVVVVVVLVVVVDCLPLPVWQLLDGT